MPFENKNTTPPSMRKTSVRKGLGEQKRTFTPEQKRAEAVDKYKESRQDKFIASLSPNLNVMIQAVQRAGRALARDFGELEKLQITKKGAADFASSADIFSEKVLREYLLKVRPRYGFLQEESGAVVGEDTSHRWIVDPLDGTTNFLHAVPHFSISLALQEDKEIVAGVVFNPITNELFYAEKGCGAWAMTPSGTVRIHVSDRAKLEEAVLTTGMPHLGHSNPDKFIRQALPLMKSTAGLRRMGSAALDMSYVAAGRFEGYWEEGIKAWDVAAGLLIVKEAGGRACSFKGDESTVDVLNAGSILVTNDRLYDKLRKHMMDAEKE